MYVASKSEMLAYRLNNYRNGVHPDLFRSFKISWFGLKSIGFSTMSFAKHFSVEFTYGKYLPDGNSRNFPPTNKVFTEKIEKERIS